MCVLDIDKALCSGNYHKLMEITNVDMVDALVPQEVKQCLFPL